LLQHHQVLHKGVSRAHNYHRQRDHTVEGTRRRRVLRPHRKAGEDLQPQKEIVAMELKPITRAGVPAALQKAERYRLLNDSTAAESICLDILRVEPESQSALVILLLSITDQFGEEQSGGVHRAREVLP